VSESQADGHPSQNKGSGNEDLRNSPSSQRRIALVGNPNTGKSSLFNALTGLQQKVGNFPGVTVDYYLGSVNLTLNGPQSELSSVTLVDLPGTYSMHPHSPEEWVTFDVLTNPDHELRPEVIVVVADAVNLKRNLLFITQIADLGLPTIVALNMMDLAEKQGVKLDHNRLASLLGVPVVSISARGGKGLEALKSAISAQLQHPQSSQISFVDITKLAPGALASARAITKGSPYASFLLLGNADEATSLDWGIRRQLQAIAHAAELDTRKMQALETTQRYHRIALMLKDILSAGEGKHNQNPQEITKKIDRWLLHPFWGYWVFATVLLVLFQAVFTFAQPFMDGIEGVFVWMSGRVHGAFPPSLMTDLVADGLLPGLGGVLIFLPQIAVLSGLLAILEDTGYMARVSFLMDRLMRRLGMNGKSVVPLMSGFACAVPAIMAARTIGDWKERLITIMVTPLMACSARLPVYAVLISFLFPEDRQVFGPFSERGLALTAMYLLGMFTGLLAGVVFQWFIKRKGHSFFILELPLYRAPRWKAVGMQAYFKSKTFVTSAGKVILLISVVLWALASFGPPGAHDKVEARFAKLKPSSEIPQSLIDQRKAAALLSESYAGRAGQLIEPVIRPLGYDWKIGIALISSFAAREVFVGTMSTIYALGSDNKVEGEDGQLLRDRLAADIDPATGKPVFTNATAWSLLVFYAFALQCMSTIAATKRETGRWKWAIIQLVYMTGLAYLASFAVYQLLS